MSDQLFDEDGEPNVVKVPERSEWWNEQVGLFAKPGAVDLENNVDLQALQALAYDGTPDEIAENFKNQGNKQLMKGAQGYYEALRFYSEGIDAKCDNAKLHSVLLSNRAHVHLQLENYGYALKDASAATDSDPTNVKAFYRAARAANKLRKYAECIRWAERGLALDTHNESLRTELESAQKLLDAEQVRERAQQETHSALATALRQRGLKMRSDGKLPAEMESKGPRVEDGALVWTLLIACDERNMVDMAEAVSEEASLRDVLQHMYAEPPAWGPAYGYSKHMELYYAAKGKWVRANLDSALGNVLALRDFVLRPVPTFHLVLGNTPFKKEFLSKAPPLESA